jgi:hypothetical protein
VIPRTKIVIPICKELGSPEVILRRLVGMIDGVTKLKRVILTTISPECFANNLAAFATVYQELIDDCKICLE